MPPYAHIHMSLDCNKIPELDDISVGFVDIQGVAITGIQGIGVNTPSFAAVAAATVWFVMVLHMPNDFIFTIGIQSAIDATG